MYVNSYGSFCMYQLIVSHATIYIIHTRAVSVARNHMCLLLHACMCLLYSVYIDLYTILPAEDNTLCCNFATKLWRCACARILQYTHNVFTVICIPPYRGLGLSTPNTKGSSTSIHYTYHGA